MKVYNDFFQLKLKTNIQYRGALILNILFGVIPLIGYIILWNSIYNTKNTFGGFTENQMITYYLISRIMIICITPDFQWEMNSDIRNGDIIKFLVMPISYFFYRFSSHLADVLIKLLMTIPVILIVYLFMFKRLFFSSWSCVLMFVIFLSIAIILSFLSFYLIMIASFFIVEIASLSYTFDMIVQFLSGAILPISIFPNSIYNIIQYTPFPYIAYFPLKVFLKPLPSFEYITAFIISIIWIFIFLILIRLFWLLGLKRFEGNES
ncbi:ABC-2 family transporter protein (plasmid) [Nicoliella spurrieriana]|uniref:ABC-2 family transporter protein n=1 Tax=Nicoliella spurrieriana TaxID=2925830 RepID=A0A976RQG5_9LACO|nr:ABC-2 family transporter protein [Nicoliella spurrieriana]UQS85953.1 ABC-2 family transporter protein [Nicoliella spurrieriana]